MNESKALNRSLRNTQLKKLLGKSNRNKSENSYMVTNEKDQDLRQSLPLCLASHYKKLRSRILSRYKSIHLRLKNHGKSLVKNQTLNHPKNYE